MVKPLPKADAIDGLSILIGSECDPDSKVLYFRRFILDYFEVAGTVSSRGQVTIPDHVRDARGIEPGDALEFEVRGHEFVSRKRYPSKSGIDWDRA